MFEKCTYNYALVTKCYKKLEVKNHFPRQKLSRSHWRTRVAVFITQNASVKHAIKIRRIRQLRRPLFSLFFAFTFFGAGGRLSVRFIYIFEAKLKFSIFLISSMAYFKNKILLLGYMHVNIIKCFLTVHVYFITNDKKLTVYRKQHKEFKSLEIFGISWVRSILIFTFLTVKNSVIHTVKSSKISCKFDWHDLFFAVESRYSSPFLFFSDSTQP